MFVLIFLFQWLMGFNVAVGNIPESEPDPFLQAFDRISSQPEILSYSYRLNIRQEGGHIQGIQRDQHHNLVVSASSGTTAWIARIETGSKPAVKAVFHLTQKPLKHAGGFQIHEDVLAVGIEDNAARNRSEIFILRDDYQHPVTKIFRQGEYQRVTAGCMGIIPWQHEWLVVAGNWDTKNLDFYTGPLDGSDTMKLVFSLEMALAGRTCWSDGQWLPYQNINLFSSGQRLFLVGLGENAASENIADVFEITVQKGNSFSLCKVASRSFGKNPDTRFKWGAGISWDEATGQMEILVTEEHLRDEGKIYIYSNQHE